MQDLQLRRLDELIAQGEQILRTYNQHGNIDKHDLWFTEAKNFIAVNMPEYLALLSSIAPKFADRLSDEAFGRASYDLIQQQIEVLKFAKSGSSVLARRIGAIQIELAGVFEPAREHYEKAIRYIYQNPVDPENSVKEIISALESIGRTLYPKATTLGDVIKELRKANALPQLLISVIEKFYAYASDEPAVRHGSPLPSKVRMEDAEFCLHVGVASIHYLIKLHNGI